MYGVSKHATRHRQNGTVCVHVMRVAQLAQEKKKRSKSLELRLKYVPLSTLGKKVVLTEILMHDSLCDQSLFLCSAR